MLLLQGRATLRVRRFTIRKRIPPAIPQLRRSSTYVNRHNMAPSSPFVALVALVANVSIAPMMACTYKNGNSYIGVRGQDRDQVAVLIQEFNCIYLHINGAIRLLSKGYSKACAARGIDRITFDEGDNAGLLTVLA